MAQTVNVNFKLDADVKKSMEKACSEMGLSMSAYSCAGVPLFRRNGYRQSGGRKPLFRNRDTALN